MGAFNSRQLRPHRTARMYVQPEEEIPEEIARILMLRIETNENEDTTVYKDNTNGSKGKSSKKQSKEVNRDIKRENVVNSSEDWRRKQQEPECHHKKTDKVIRILIQRKIPQSKRKSRLQGM